MDKIEELFIPYEQALALKELGFDEPCFGLWNLNNGKHEVDIIGLCEYSKKFKYRQVLAPLYQQAFRWFREKYPDLDFGIGKIHNGTNNYHYHVNLTWEFFEGTYKEAELACLIKLIEIVKSTKNI